MPGLRFASILAALVVPCSAQVAERDSDSDGLSDFAEVHKHLTDPSRADSDRDGVDDGDWLERREFNYTVRSVVHVMRPVTLEFLTDDYQDARLLDEGPDFVELEVVHYPFNTVADALEADDGWRKPAKEVARWLEAGPTSDWTPKMRKELLMLLEKSGIDVAKLDDRETVEQVSRWLMEHAESHDGFSSFLTAFDERGKPFVPAELEPAMERERTEHGLTLAEQWEREISARGMFEQGVRGSCTSSAIYLSGCLRAVGIPTRTVLCIPAIDASDPREHEMAEARLEHGEVRAIVLGAARGAEQSWTSHTFNEVWVGGRWRRLNYSELGQNILDRRCLGLMTHVATFHDWADARMPETVGRRQTLQLRADLFGGANPYSTISLRDAFGPHYAGPKPAPRELEVAALHWTDSPELPADIRANCAERGRFGLIAEVVGLQGSDDFASFVDRADRHVSLEAPKHPTLETGFDPGCWWYEDERALIYLPFDDDDRRELVEGVEYEAHARNETPGFAWKLDLRVRR